jgi:hypothetical protein
MTVGVLIRPQSRGAAGDGVNTAGEGGPAVRGWIRWVN